MVFILAISKAYKIPNFLFKTPFTTKSQKIPFKDNLFYRSKGYSQRIFFPIYAKTSKMINNNRYGKHSLLEHKLKRRERKWK